MFLVWFLSGFLASKGIFVGLAGLSGVFGVTKTFPWSLQVGLELFFHKHPKCVVFVQTLHDV